MTTARVVLPQADDEDWMTRADRFLEVLAELGGSAGNGRCRNQLEWQETTYHRVREVLLVRGRIVRGRGRGRSVAIAGELTGSGKLER